MVGTLRHRLMSWAVLLATATAFVVSVPDGRADAVTIAEVVSDNPVNWTPNVLDGQVDAIAQVGDRIIIGGTFTQVEDDVAVYDRTSIAAFDAATGVIDTGFNPTLDGTVSAIVPAADGTSAYITGTFNTVNGTTERKVARIDAATGERVSGFDTPVIFSEVRDARLVGDDLIIGGLFSEVGNQPRTALASLNATTGALTTTVNLTFAGVHNGGATLVAKMDVTPAGDKLLVIGNFTSVDGHTRDQIALLDLSGTMATVADWYTPFYESECASVFSSFMRDLDIDPTGTFAVVSTTGAYRGGIEAGVSCDTISRWELGATGTNLTATWVTYTGGDTTYAVEVGPGVVYAGGHMRWVNNPYEGDYAGPGAISRDGIVALDTVNGMPYSWDPGRTRGVGVFDMLLTDRGLWAGSDTDRWANELRMKLALFPSFNGTDVEEYVTGSLPNHVDALGRVTSPGIPDASVLYRVNAGGPAIPSADDGPSWEADTAASSSYRNSGSSSATYTSVRFIESSIPSNDFDRTSLSVFESERWDAASGAEMAWSFPVASGTPIQVRLYFANRCACTDMPGERVFDIDLDGVRVVEDLDLTLQHGHETAAMHAFDIVSDGAVDIVFGHQTENPLVNAIEIIELGVPGGSITTADEVTRRYLDPAAGAGAATVATGSEAWRWARGGFMVNSTVYTGWADGSMQARTMSAGLWGNPTRVELYGNTLMPDMINVTGMFFDPVDARVYYTLEGDPTLYWRWFTPESGSLGATAFTASGDVTTMAPGRVQGMALADGWVYFADQASGDLLRVGFAGGVVSGPVTTVDATMDWRSRALIVSTNQPPTAAVAADCTYRDCDFDVEGSSDLDGTIVTYDWDFGDGTTGDGPTPSHHYEDVDTYTVTLTVTDNEGLTATTSLDVTATNAPPTASFSESCSFHSCDFDAEGSSDPDGTIVTYDWDFGDGTTGNGPTPSHHYENAGTYTVTLTVTDNDGVIDNTARPLTVTSPPPVHLHDLTPAPYDLEGAKWVARVIVKVRDADGNPSEGVEISGVFGAGKERACVTNAKGKCKMKVKIADTKPKIPVEITAVEWDGGYDAAANRDPDGDGNSERTVIRHPAN